MELIFLGTGAGNGVPAFYCNCRVCLEATENPRFRRTRCAVALIDDEVILIDAPPELAAQLLREKISRIDCLFLTHAHHDHCAGLGALEIYTRFYRGDKLPVIMNFDTQKQLEKSHDTLQEWMDISLLNPGESVNRSNVKITAIDAMHCAGAMGYMFSHADHKVAYLPDTGPLADHTKKMLFGLDTLILDTTFWGKNWYPEKHLAFDETLSIARELDVGTLYLTHLSMHYSEPVTNREIERAIEPFMGRVKLAYDGMQIVFGEK